MPKIIDLCNKRFGRLIVLEKAYTKNYTVYWKCKCDCGNIKYVSTANLTTGNVKSCGCLNRETGNYTHNLSKHRLYGIHSSMICRCTMPSHKYYKDYGGRGIYICEEWYTPNTKGNPGFVEFYKWSYENGYYDQPTSTPKRDILTIDRIDTDGPYAPWNCRWLPLKYQGSNKRNNHVTIIDGTRYTDAQLSRKYNVSKDYIKHKRFGKWSSSAIIYALEHPELGIHKAKGGYNKTKAEDFLNKTYLDKDGFQILIPKLCEEEPG